MTVSRGLSPHSAAGINPAHAVPLFGFLYYTTQCVIFQYEKHIIGCSVRFYGFGAATSAVDVTAGASIARITVFVCSGGQGATVRVQSITALKESHVRDSGAKSP